MSNNLFNGSIPPCLKNPMVPLIDLSLRNNNFNGVLPDIFANATKLRSLDVSYNQLEGDFPKSFMNCKALQLVNVESNKLKDKFPLWLGSLPSLHVLILRSNEFYGPLYHNHMSIGFQSLRVIDVSHNDFSGTLPPNYFFSRLEMTTLPEENDYMIDFVNATSLGNSSLSARWSSPLLKFCFTLLPLDIFFLRVFVSFLWVCVVSIVWLRVVHVTSPAYGSGRNVFLAGSGL
ncbi:hypothetical protein YC2023_079018 [Brassica napus]